jgi:putative membrane protein
VSTLVVCLDRGSTLPSDLEPPIVGREDVESLMTAFGLSDPEDSRVNTVLEGIRVAEELQADGEDAEVAVLSSSGDAVSADREVAQQVEDLLQTVAPDSAVVVVDSAEDERLVPIIESRVRVDAVDRVVVRQARDIESTYYLLKQFLADEELRKTTLVPIGAALLAFPILLLVAESTAVAVGAIAAAIGTFLLYKGLGVDDYLATLPAQIREAMYSGQVSLVTYVVAGGLSLVGIFAGALGVSGTSTSAEFILAMRFVFDSVPWFSAAALAAATGRLIDELMQEDEIRSAFVNLPFVAIALGMAVRGFAGYFLEISDVFSAMRVGRTDFGPVTIDGFALDPGQRLALFILASVLISLVGVRVAAYVSNYGVEDELLEEPGT